MEPSIGRITSGLKEVSKSVWCIEVADAADGLPEDSMVLTPVRRRCALSLEKAISIGLRSGLYDGVKRIHVSRALEDGLGFLASMAGEIVEDHNVAGTESGSNLGFDIGFEGRPIHGAVDDHGAVRPQQRRAALKVCVFQRRKGARAGRRWSRRARPHSRIIFVVVAVSSIKTSRRSSLRNAGWR